MSTFTIQFRYFRNKIYTKVFIVKYFEHKYSQNMVHTTSDTLALQIKL